ncbi:MAG: hypothetical protein ACYS26_09475 [Planctomycetota bacterium]|jgi:hypothetical protein
MLDPRIPTGAFQASPTARVARSAAALGLGAVLLLTPVATADDPPPPPTPTDPPSYPTLAMPLGRQLQLITYFDNEFCASDCGAACDVGSGWVRIDQGPNNSTAGLSTNYHVRHNDLYFGANVDAGSLLPVAEVVQANFDTTGLPERNVTAGPSRVANGGGGIWELQGGDLVYVAPIPWSAGLLNAKNGSISGAWAFREGELYQYNGAQWVSQLTVVGAAGTVTSNGSMVYVDESTAPPTLRLLENSGFGFWYESASYQGEEVADWLSFEFSDEWLVANGDGDGYGIFRRGAAGDLVLVDLWQREKEQDPYYWMELKGNGTSFVRLEYVEPSAVDLFRLETDTSSASISAAGQQQLTVCTPETWAGRTFLILGSVNGTVPGILFEGDVLPINYDAYMHYLLVATGAGMILPQVGTLNSNGKGVNTIQLPPGLHPDCVGVVAHHLALLFDPAGGANVYLRSVGPATLELVP